MSKNFLKRIIGFVFVSVFAIGIYGCEKAKDVPVVEEKSPVKTEVKTETKAEAKTSTIPADWHLYTDDVRGFSIAYPLAKDSGVNAETGVTLPNAVGNKDRTLKIEAYNPAKVDLDADGCVKNGAQTPSMKGKQKIHGVNFCLIAFDEGAMGSTYRTYHYTTKLSEVIDVSMTIRFPNSIKEYAGCENDADQSSEKCKELGFDESRDTKLFADIMKTFNKK
jgi:hypothetical protein